MNYSSEYKKKLVSADEAVKVVKSGDWVAYSHFVMFPKILDQALAKRVGELSDVKVKASTGMFPAEIAVNDPDQTSFMYHSCFFSHNDRKLGDRGLAYFLPGTYRGEVQRLLDGHTAKPNVAMIKTTPIDKHGYFNFGTSCSFSHATVKTADTVIVEVNESVPRCLGGNNERVHVSDVDYIVDGGNEPLVELPIIPVTEEDEKIASFVMEEIEDDCCIQLGIGGIPNSVGHLIADSDLKNLGFHSEMMVDSAMVMYDRGIMTGASKSIDRYKMAYTFCMGSRDLYEFLDNNPACAAYSVDYINGYDVISKNDKVISVNNGLQVDLFGQICSESQGYRQISGTGGQLDFVIGATMSKKGKAFICLKSTRMHEGKRISRIVPEVQGIVTVPRSKAFYVVTEYGKVNLKGKSVWQIAELLISIAHPDFKEELIREAEKMGLWTKANKRL